MGPVSSSSLCFFFFFRREVPFPSILFFVCLFVLVALVSFSVLRMLATCCSGALFGTSEERQMWGVTRRWLCRETRNAPFAGPAPPLTTGGCCSSSSTLATLPHPIQLEGVAFQSVKWRHAVRRLYRVIFKLHVLRLLPLQREFGDRFVQVEFQRHVDANEKHSRIFYESWYGYVAQLDAGQTSREMTEEERRQLSPEQKETLRELRSHVLQARQTNSDFML